MKNEHLGFFKLVISKWNNVLNNCPFLFITSFSHHNDKYCTIFDFKMEKAYMMCMEFELGTEGWYAQTNPLSYGDPPKWNAKR